MIPIFIGGTGRSGTTILKRILSCHPQISSIPYELRVIVDPGGALDLKLALSERWSPYHADHAIRTFRQLMLRCKKNSWLRKAEYKFLPKLGIAPRRYGVVGLASAFGKSYYRERLYQLIDRLTYYFSKGNWVGSPSYMIPAKIIEAHPHRAEEISRLLAEFFHDLFRNRAEDSDKTHWIDDTPTNLLHAGELLEMFPNMRFIHIHRDLRDVLASYQGFSWGGDNMVVSAQRLSDMMARWLDIREKLPTSTYLEVGLEFLASSPDAFMTKICNFIGLEYCQELKTGVTQFNPRRMHEGRWKTEVSPETINSIMPYLFKYLEIYGYKTN